MSFDRDQFGRRSGRDGEDLVYRDGGSLRPLRTATTAAPRTGGLSSLCRLTFFNAPQRGTLCRRRRDRGGSVTILSGACLERNFRQRRLAED